MKRATAGTIDDSDLMQRAVKGMMLGLSGDTMVKIAEMARLGARVAGTSVADALEGITNAVATGMPKALKQYGLALGPEVKIITAAQTAGVEGINLMTLAQINFDIQLARHGAIQANANEQTQVFEAQIHDLKETLGGALLSVLRIDYGMVQTFGSGFMYAAGATNYLVAGMAGVAAWTADKLGFTEKAKAIKAYADFATATAKKLMADADAMKNRGMANITGNAEKGKSGPGADSQARVAQLEKEKKAFLQNIKDQTAAVKNAAKDRRDAEKSVEAATKAAIEATRKATYEIETVGDSQYKKDLAQIKAEADKYREAGVDKVVVAKFVAAETELALRKSFEVDAADRKKIYDEQVKASEEYRKMVAEEQSFSVDKHTAAMLKITANEETKLLAAEKMMDEGGISWDKYQAYLVEVQKNTALAVADLLKQELSDKANFYATITGYEDTYRQKMIAFIDAQLAADIAAGEDSVAATKKAEEAKLQYANTYFSGIQIGLNSIYKDYEDVGKGMADVTKTAFSDMTNSLVDYVKTGKLNFESLIDNMITGLIKLMVQEQMAGLAKSASGWLSGLFNSSELAGANPLINSAQGNVFDYGNVIPFSRGGIVNRPMIFPMARGAGLMGEAGPEAVMPLTRLAGGDLGVRSIGGGGGEVTVNIINNAGAQVTQTQKETPRGLEIDVMIDQLVAKKLSQRGSSSNRTIRSNFGARETLIAR
jgi:lambda family phage tail tape measure protein